MINKPLIELLKKNGFEWNDKVKATFNSLKRAMTQVAILTLPDFNKPFNLETGACDTRVGVVLVQEGRPIAFLSQALAPKHLGLSIYDKELKTVLMAVENWRYYFEGNSFVIRTDYESLKFLGE